jgi:hypothetical protein
VDDPAELAESLDELDVLLQRRLAASLRLGLHVRHHGNLGAHVVEAVLGLGGRVLVGEEVVGEVERVRGLGLRDLGSVVGVHVVGPFDVLDAHRVDAAEVHGALDARDIRVEQSRRCG